MTLDDIAPGATPEELVRESFVYLLEREPRESIMRAFELPIIARFFGDYPDEISRRLRGADGPLLVSDLPGGLGRVATEPMTRTFEKADGKTTRFQVPPCAAEGRINPSAPSSRARAASPCAALRGPVRSSRSAPSSLAHLRSAQVDHGQVRDVQAPQPSSLAPADRWRRRSRRSTRPRRSRGPMRRRGATGRPRGGRAPRPVPGGRAEAQACRDRSGGGRAR